MIFSLAAILIIVEWVSEFLLNFSAYFGLFFFVRFYCLMIVLQLFLHCFIVSLFKSQLLLQHPDFLLQLVTLHSSSFELNLMRFYIHLQVDT